MFIRAPAEVGAVIRDRRKHLKLNQATFARRIGVSRQWVIQIERGRPRAELGLVLRALDALDIQLDARPREPRRRRSGAVDVDAIVAKAKKAKP
jgi:HTH-type transcriptional regulator/antitoxin HipB